MSQVAGMILCGGESRRMGRSKAFLPFGPVTLLEHVARTIGSVCDPVLAVAAPSQELPSLPDTIRIVRDEVAHQGPLQGLATGLAAFPDSVDLVYVTSTDAPFLRREWVARLVELIGDHDLIIVNAHGYYHPLAAVYRRGAVLPAVRSLLAADRRRPFFLVEAVRSRIVSEEEMKTADPDLISLRNLNTPEDYARALEDAGLSGPLSL